MEGAGSILPPTFQIASDLRFAIRITNRNRNQIARFGALSTPFTIAYLNDLNKLKIGIGIGKFPVMNTQESQIGKFLTGQGRREDRGWGAVSVPVTKLI